MTSKLENLPSDFLVAMAEYLDLPSQKALIESSKTLHSTGNESLNIQLREAIKTPGIYQKAFQQNKSLREMVQKVDSLLIKAKGLRTPQELRAAGLNPDIQKLAPFEKIKLAELIAEKRASILVIFFVRLGPLIPELNQFLQQLTASNLSLREMAKEIRDWLQTHPDILEEGDVVAPFLESAPDLNVPSEALLFKNIPLESYKTLLKKSAQKGHFELLEAILHSEASGGFVVKDIQDALYHAIDHNQGEVFKRLMQTALFGEVPPEELGKMFALAAEKGHLKIVHSLINLGLSAESFGEALVQACKFNQQSIVEKLLQSPRADAIPLPKVEEAVDEATAIASVALFETLMRWHRFHEISREGFGSIVAGAVEFARKKIFEKLKTDPRFHLIPLETFAEVLRIAIEMGHNELIDPLIASPLFEQASGPGLALAFFWAVRENRLDIVQAFIASPSFKNIPLKVSEKKLYGLKDSFDVSVDWGHSEIAQALRNCSRFSELSQKLY